MKTEGAARRTAEYQAPAHTAAAGAAGAPLQPPSSRKVALARLCWNVVWHLLYRPSPRPLHAWRALLLKLFGAKLGPQCHFYPGSRVWAPWMLHCERNVTLADGAELFNPALFQFGDHAIVSQGAYVCGAMHDPDDPAFPLLACPMTFGAYAWVCAGACVGPGANFGEGAVLGLGSVSTNPLEAWTVYAGSPAVRIRERRRDMPAPARQA